MDGRVATIEAKSTAPFHLMLQAVRLSIPCAEESNRENQALITERIGVVFWLIDDLVDLTRDYRAGAANSILFGLRSRKASAEEIIDGTVDRLCRSLAETSNILADIGTAESRQFCNLLLGYVRSWAE
jgi:hypothetical protein